MLAPTPSPSPGSRPTVPPAVPSVVPLRPLGVAELLDGAVRVVRTNARAAFGLALPIAIVRAALLALLALYAVAGTSGDLGVSFTSLLGQLLVGLVFGTVLTGLLAPAVSGEVAGRRRTGADCLRAVRALWVPLAGVVVVIAVAEEVGAVAFFVGGAWLWGIWALAPSALVVEQLGVGGALRRSFALVRTQFWRVWGVRSLRWVLTWVLSALITVPFSLLATWLSGSDLLTPGGPTIEHPAVYVAITTFGTLIALTLTTPISAAFDTLLYVDLRMRCEGMDIVMSLPPLPEAGTVRT